MSKPIEKLREHFNGRPVPKGAKCLAEEREKVNAMIDAVEAENAKLRRAAERDADVMESLNLSLEESQAGNTMLREQNAELQSRVAELEELLPENGRYFRAETVEAYVAENAKLREYAESYAKSVECEGCGWCPYDMDLVCDTETMPMRDGCKLYDELRELGIEVDA